MDRTQLNKGDVVELTIASLADGGEGVTREMGTPIFVNRTAPGDRIRARVFDVRKDFARAEMVELVQPSPQRCEPPCKLFKVCGGCQWQHVDYAHQLEAKTEIVRQALKRIGRLPPDLVLPAIGAIDPLYYRNKVQFPVDSVRATGRILAGYYQQNSHELVNIKHCPVQPESLDRALAAAKAALEKQRLSTYDETTGRGMLRHIAERFSFAENRVLVTLVLNCPPPLRGNLKEKIDAAAFDIIQSVPEVCGVCVNFNDRPGNRIMGDTTICVAGDDHITEVLRSNLPWAPSQLRDGIRYHLSASSFFQVNSKQAAVLLDEMLKAVVANGNNSTVSPDPSKKLGLIIDAYAGVGTMALWLASIADNVLAIEEWPAAVEDGLRNRDVNHLTNVEFKQAKVEDEAPRLVAAGLMPEVVVVDPPRKGLHLQALESLTKMQPRRIVYVSCNPATLARDLRILDDKGYKTKRVQPVDMFPQTFHIESVALIERSPN